MELVQHEEQVQEGPDPALETEAAPLFRPEDVAVFESKSRKLRLVRFPANDRPTAFGMIREHGIVYEFDGGYFRVTETVHRDDARAFATIRRRLSDDEAELLDTRPAEEWLRDHRLFDNPAKGGFVELDRQTHAPDPAPVLGRIAELAAGADVEGLERIYREEEETHRRPQVLEAVLATLRVLEGQQTQPDGAETPPGEES